MKHLELQPTLAEPSQLWATAVVASRTFYFQVQYNGLVFCKPVRIIFTMPRLCFGFKYIITICLIGDTAKRSRANRVKVHDLIDP